MTQPFTTSEEHDLVLAAYIKALAAGVRVTKSGEADTGKYKYRYTELNQLMPAIDRVLSENGAYLSQVPSGDPAGQVWTLTTTIWHDSGQWMAFEPLHRPPVRDEQGFGSALTYNRRYALLAIFGIAPSDDDGTEATRQQRNQAQYDGNRTPEELAIRTIIKIQSEDNRKLLVDQFKSAFNKTLSDLPERKHSEALTWVLDWVASDPEPDTTVPSLGES